MIDRGIRLTPRNPTYKQEITLKYRSPNISSAPPNRVTNPFARANRPSKKSVSPAHKYIVPVASHKFGKGQRTTKPKTSATLAMDRPWTIQNHVCHLLRHAIIPSYPKV